MPIISMLPLFWVAEQGRLPRKLEMIYFVPNTVRPTIQEIRLDVHTLFGGSRMAVVSSFVIRLDQDQEPGNASLDSFFNSVLPHSIPLPRPTTTCNFHVSDPFRNKS